MNLVPPLNYSGSVSPSPSPGPSSMQPSNEDIGSARKLTSAQPSPADASIGVSVSVPATPADPSIRNCGENPNSLPASIESDGMISELAFSMRHNPLDKPPQPLQQGTESEEHIDRTPQDIAQSLIDKFKAAKGDRSQRNILIKEDDINTILLTVREVFMSQPMLIEVEAPVKICGDIHGQFYDLLRLFDKCGYPSEATPFLFLGDYVDRGKHSIETITLLYCYKIIYPKYITLLRGNHECGAINRQYGFFDDVKRRYNTRLFKLFTNIFDTMPISCLVGTKIICMHGGLSPELGDLRLINQIQRPCDVPSRGIMCDLLWSDPTEDEDATGFVPSSRGVGWEFGPDMVEAFLDHVDLDLIVRAHQVMERGYGFFADRQLVTIFSAPDYCGEYDNDAAVMNVDEKLQCSFTVLPPRRRAGK